MELYCKTCNELLTFEPLVQAEETELKFVDEQELLQRNKFIEASKTDFNFDFPFDLIINSDSIELNDHKDRDRFSGCCGTSNFHVYNQVCFNCSAELGVIIADCCFPVFVAIDSSKVSKESFW